MGRVAFQVTRLANRLRGSSLTARVVRSSALTVAGFGFSQGIRLISNLFLTRLLFPEAFGLMALVTTMIVGLNMFSDVGIGPAIMRSKRGDDPVFLNSAFTLQVIRGVVLFVLGCVLAYPIAAFYEEDVLFPMLVVASVQFLIFGFRPTGSETAQRHLLVGRITLLDAVSQIIALTMMLALAIWTKSVWALVFGGLFGSATTVLLYRMYLPGVRNRLCWDRDAIHELLHFGKWIFLSTVFGFLIAQGDRLILGKYLSLDVFGIYIIGFFLGSFPLMLGGSINRRLLIPVYRDRPPSESRGNFIKLRRLRTTFTSCIIALIGISAFFGPWLVEFLYDDRYRSAGVIVVLVACFSIPQAIGMTYDAAALAVGDSRAFFLLTAARAMLTTIGLVVGVSIGGLVGALVGQFLATLLVYPGLIWLSARLGAWDMLHDAAFASLGALIFVTALWRNWQEIALLVIG